MYQVEKKIRHVYVKTLRVDVKWTRSGREGTEISLMHFFYAVVIDNAYSPNLIPSYIVVDSYQPFFAEEYLMVGKVDQARLDSVGNHSMGGAWVEGWGFRIR